MSRDCRGTARHAAAVIKVSTSPERLAGCGTLPTVK